MFYTIHNVDGGNMEKQGCNFFCILFMAVIIAIFAAMPVSNAATISGTVYKEDGSSPVNDANIFCNNGPHRALCSL